MRDPTPLRKAGYSSEIREQNQMGGNPLALLQREEQEVQRPLRSGARLDRGQRQGRGLWKEAQPTQEGSEPLAWPGLAGWRTGTPGAYE